MTTVKIWRSRWSRPPEGKLELKNYTLIDTISIDPCKVNLDMSDNHSISKFISEYFFTYQVDKTKKYNYKDTYHNTSQYRHLAYPDIIQIDNRYFMILDVEFQEVYL